MKRLPIFLSIALFAANVFASTQDCSEKVGCDAKECQIEKQLSEAKKADNSHEIAGLEKALEQVKEHCTNQDLKDELREKIADKEDEVAEHQDDLREALKGQDREKVKKYKQKLTEDIDELNMLKQELAKLHQ